MIEDECGLLIFIHRCVAFFLRLSMHLGPCGIVGGRDRFVEGVPRR